MKILFKSIIILILIIPIQLLAQSGQVYVNTFQDLSDGVINETAVNNVRSLPIIGTRTPQVNKALTIEHTVAGSNTWSKDLGQAYQVLYFQYYVSVINKSGANTYTNNAEVGSAVEANHAYQILFRHQSTSEQIYGQSSADGFFDTSYRTALGVWNKIGIKLDKNTMTADLYINNEYVGTEDLDNRDLRFVTLGGTGNGQVGYKVQYTALSINTLGFQDIINNTNGVGKENQHFVDYSILQNPDYSDSWSGLHSEAIDLDGDGTFDDGPKAYMYDVGVSNNYGRTTTQVYMLSGVVYKTQNLTKGHKMNTATAGSFNATNFQRINYYGSVFDPLPIIDSSMLVNPADWEVYDAINNIYRVPVVNGQNATGGWQTGEIKAFRQVFDLSNLQIYSGGWHATTTHFYVRLWDDSDPSLQEISIGTNQKPTFRPFTEIRNIQWRHASLIVVDNMLVENCEFTQNSGASVTESVFRDNVLFDNWSGTDYGNTEAVNPGLGTGKSGEGGGIGVYENALVYRNIITDSYLAVTIASNAHDAVFAFNLIKNTIVNSITISGTADGDTNRRALIANNTVFCGGRHIDNDPYPIVRPQPNHGFVHQNSGGFGGAYTLVNNLFLLHYNENTGFSGQNNNSTANIISSTAVSLANASGRHGYNKFYKTPISNSPSVIFNLGVGDNITAWRTALASQGDFLDIDGISNPDTTSSVTNVLPVVQADYTATSGKWLTTDPTPTVTGGGLDIDYSVYGIYTDLAGNPLGNDLSIGAIGSVGSDNPTTYTYSNGWSPSNPIGIATPIDDINIINGDITINTNTQCNQLSIEAGCSVTVNSGVTMTTSTTELNSTSTQSSSIIVNGILAGTINYNKHTASVGPVGTNDLISTPLSGQTFGDFEASNPNLPNSGTTISFGIYNTINESFENYDEIVNSSTLLNSGTGYRAATTDGNTLTFTGTVLTSDVLDIPIIGDQNGAGWNLIGNPYPCYIDFETFFTTNQSQFVPGSLFQAVYGYDGNASNGWTVWNLATIADNTVTELLAPGQAFFVKAKPDGGLVDFKTDMRRIGSSDDFILGRSANPINVALNNLTLTSTTNTANTSIYFIEGTTRGFDSGYDAGSFQSNTSSFLIFTNLVEDNEDIDIAIQSLPYNDFNNVVVPLGIKAEANVNLTISIEDSTSTLPDNINVYLEDTETNTLTLLNDSDYTFITTNAMTGTGRFFLRYSAETLSSIGYQLDNLLIFLNQANKELVIKGQLNTNSSATLYDLQGRVVFNTLLNSSKNINTIDVNNISKGIYIFKLSNGTSVKTKKIVIR